MTLTPPKMPDLTEVKTKATNEIKNACMALFIIMSVIVGVFTFTQNDTPRIVEAAEPDIVQATTQDELDQLEEAQEVQPTANEENTPEQPKEETKQPEPVSQAPVIEQAKATIGTKIEDGYYIHKNGKKVAFKTILEGCAANANCSKLRDAFTAKYGERVGLKAALIS